MTKQLLVTTFIFASAACTPSPQAGDVGPKGDTGPQGPPGSSGVCDTSSCSQITSVEGLQGGNISGTTTFSNVVVTDGVTVSSTAPTPRGTIVSRGGQQTSVGGFYCGKTIVTSGAGAPTGGGSSGDDLGMWAIKRRCETVCGNPAAHACLTTEIMMTQALGGGRTINVTDNVRYPNTAIPVPLDNESGWVLAPDGVSSCNSLQDSSSGNQGVAFHMGVNGGDFQRQACDQTLPFFCCL